VQHRLILVLSTVVLLGLVGCSAEVVDPEPDAGAEAAVHPLSGLWSGNWGPSANDRNTVNLEFHWDGATLGGTVNPGPSAVALTKANYDPATGMLSMEAHAPGRNGGTLHYVIEGKVEGNAISGSWSHDDRKGDFSLMKN
jgi:hypothetical protein